MYWPNNIKESEIMRKEYRSPDIHITLLDKTELLAASGGDDITLEPGEGTGNADGAFSKQNSNSLWDEEE